MLNYGDAVAGSLLAGGTMVATKKEQIRTSFTTRKAEYLSKVAQIKADG
jgi:hypothetical protein